MEDTEVADTEVAATEVADTEVVDTEEEGMDMAAAATEEASGMDIMVVSLSTNSGSISDISAEPKQLPSCRHQKVMTAYFFSRYLRQLLKHTQIKIKKKTKENSLPIKANFYV
ncbi:hypothetical protein IscW_ISCW013022, partial [Ixodes scapularis]